MDTVKQKFVLLICFVLVSFTAGKRDGTDVTTAKAESKIIIKKFDRNDLSRDEISAKIKQSLQGTGN